MCSSKTEGERMKRRLSQRQSRSSGGGQVSCSQTSAAANDHRETQKDGSLSLSNLVGFSLLSLILSQAQLCRNLKSTATIHDSIGQRGLHHWWLPFSLSFCFILWLIWWLGYESLRISFGFRKWGLVDPWILICALLKLFVCFRMGF